MLAANGYIYCAPVNTSTITKINTADDTVSTFGSISNSYYYRGAVLHGNGKIYFMPGNSPYILEVDPSDDSVATLGSFSGTFLFGGGVTALNGDIYAISFNYASMMKIALTDEGGKLTTTPPTDIEASLMEVGYSIDTTTLHIHLQPPILL